MVSSSRCPMRCGTEPNVVIWCCFLSQFSHIRWICHCALFHSLPNWQSQNHVHDHVHSHPPMSTSLPLTWKRDLEPFFSTPPLSENKRRKWPTNQFWRDKSSPHFLVEKFGRHLTLAANQNPWFINCRGNVLILAYNENPKFINCWANVFSNPMFIDLTLR